MLLTFTFAETMTSIVWRCCAEGHAFSDAATCKICAPAPDDTTSKLHQQSSPRSTCRDVITGIITAVMLQSELRKLDSAGGRLTSSIWPSIGYPQSLIIHFRSCSEISMNQRGYRQKAESAELFVCISQVAA